MNLNKRHFFYAGATGVWLLANKALAYSHTAKVRTFQTHHASTDFLGVCSGSGQTRIVRCSTRCPERLWRRSASFVDIEWRGTIVWGSGTSRLPQSWSFGLKRAFWDIVYVHYLYLQRTGSVESDPRHVSLQSHLWRQFSVPVGRPMHLLSLFDIDLLILQSRDYSQEHIPRGSRPQENRLHGWLYKTIRHPFLPFETTLPARSGQLWSNRSPKILLADISSWVGQDNMSRRGWTSHPSSRPVHKARRLLEVAASIFVGNHKVYRRNDLHLSVEWILLCLRFVVHCDQQVRHGYAIRGIYFWTETSLSQYFSALGFLNELHSIAWQTSGHDNIHCLVQQILYVRYLVYVVETEIEP